MKFEKTFTTDYKRFRYYIDDVSVSSDKFYDWKYICQLRCQLGKAEFEYKDAGFKSQNRKYEIVSYRSI